MNHSADVPSRFVKDASEKMQEKPEMKSFNDEKVAAYMMGRWKNGMFTSLYFIGNQQANRHNHLQDPPLSSTLMVISRSMPSKTTSTSSRKTTRRRTRNVPSQLTSARCVPEQTFMSKRAMKVRRSTRRIS